MCLIQWNSTCTKNVDSYLLNCAFALLQCMALVSTQFWVRCVWVWVYECMYDVCMECVCVVCVWICVSVSVWVYAWCMYGMYVCVFHGSAHASGAQKRITLGVVLRYYPPSCFWGRVPLACNSQSSLCCLAREPHRSAWLSLPSVGVTSSCNLALGD